MYKNMKKKVTRKFKSGGLQERHVVATWKLGEPSQHSLVDIGKPRKTCVEVAGPASEAKQQYTHSTTNTHD